MTELNSRQEYLKRYLEGPKKSKSKKKKREKRYKQSRFKIVDEDIDLKKIEVFKDADKSDEDEAPVVVSVIDERPEDVKVKEMYSDKCWKKVDSSVKVKSESTDQCNSSDDFFPDNVVAVKTRYDSEDDQSPPRSTSVELSCGSMQKLSRSKNLPIVRHDSDSDISPPRQKSTDTSDSDLSPPRSKVTDHHHHHKQRDFSPPRSKVTNHHHKQRDFSPPRSKISDHHHKQRYFSPPRNKVSNHHHHYEKKGFTDSRGKTDDHRHEQNNYSPPRGKPKDQHKFRDFSSSRKKANDWCSKQDFCPSKSKSHDLCNEPRDFSPPRRKQKNPKNSSGSSKESNNQMQLSSDSDFSPPRKRTYGDDERLDLDNNAELKKIRKELVGSYKSSHQSSLPEKSESKRTKKRHDSDSDSSSSSDKEWNSAKGKNMSSPHHGDSHSSVPKSCSYRVEGENHKLYTSGDSGEKKKRPMSTLSGMKAGLQDSSSLQKEIHNLKHREKMALNELSDELSGRNAETVSRDKQTGRRRNLKEERLKQKEKEKKNTEKLEKYLEWGKGLQQKDDQQKRLQEDMYEMSKPLARYVDDDDLERQLKDELKEGDPMLEYIKKKRGKSQLAIASSLPEYEGPPPPPNRFNIPPGYRWDGVDRSNGFEKRYFEKINSTKATEHQAYLWSIENM